MRVDEIIRRLQKENPDEEVVMVLEDEPRYLVIDPRPFLHAGPTHFMGKGGTPYKKSVVILRVDKK